MGVLTQSPGGGSWSQEDKEGTIAALAQEERGHLAEKLVPGQQVEGTWEAGVTGQPGDPKEISCPCLISLSLLSSLIQNPTTPASGPPVATHHPGLSGNP